MSAAQELPLDLSAQYAAAMAASASASSQNDGESSGPRHRKEKKMRRSRKAFSSLQVEELKRQFQRNQYPNQKEATDLASSLGLTVFQVYFTF